MLADLQAEKGPYSEYMLPITREQHEAREATIGHCVLGVMSGYGARSTVEFTDLQDCLHDLIGEGFDLTSELGNLRKQGLVRWMPNGLRGYRMTPAGRSYCYTTLGYWWVG